MKILLLCLLPLMALGAEYEFLTPGVLVIKSSKPGEFKDKGITKSGFWLKENGLQREKNGKILRKPDTTCFHYLLFEKPFAHGEKRKTASLSVVYDHNKPTQIFKVNQVGYGAKQKQKFAFMGAWLGSAGALPLKHLAGQNFELKRNSDGKTVYKNALKLRREDPLFKGKLPFTGEEVLEIDFSEFHTPGEYYIYVPGIGRSMTFAIGSAPISEAFYLHARGLYHKRCGIAKSAPYTCWEAPACHPTVMLGRFPGNWEHYNAREEKSSGFFDRKGNRLEIRHFDLIKNNPPYKNVTLPARGGWHDAADYDRRPYHLRIVSDLATVYLMKSENFIDGQLNLPESGNKIPDILDEAAWGLKHLLAVQLPNGGVGTWFETTGHPGAGEKMPDQELRTYYVSAPSRNGTLEYAAAASTLALAMKKANAPTEAEKLLHSAVKAWAFAMEPANRHAAYFRLKTQMISYHEEPFLSGENLLKAGVNLYTLTGDQKYLDPLLSERERIAKEFNKDFWKWSPLSWMVLELFPVKELEKFRKDYAKVICRNGEKMLQEQSEAYPYRTLWRAHNDGWVHAMGWGNYHPLRRAMTLIAAHRITGDEKFLTGAYLANDFHNGVNPLGRTMSSGLGKIYPVLFLDLISYNGNFREFVPGIAPYGNTFGIDRNAVRMVYGNKAEELPVFRRYVNLEFLSVPASEYTVWETIAPAAVVSGYLIEKPALPTQKLKNRKPAPDFRLLPGYRALP